MAFQWGNTTEIIFSCWPGPRSWAFVFWLSLLVEWISHARLVRPGISNVAAGLMRTAMYTVRIVAAYMVMLAVMSFDVSALIAAVAGHAGGFLLFGSWGFRKKLHGMDYQDPSDSPPLNS
ncbi:hypothetical protein EUGRSUZ_J01974 [Eucalyptus grandis]|uniref:Copper transport protein n=2 Tax=Eucalyptus grandis TaxID=71139 RepID=A0A059AFJ1_EUCGR|nr:hypothetical protein EUGRSUZ_J01974 [Eucalyptus grandis]